MAVSPLDWLVLAGALVCMVLYGLWRGRGSRDLGGYHVAGRTLRWPTVALSIMATQASAVTFLSTPGQGYVDGLRFVQFYFGLPLAMIALCLTAVPIFHRLKVLTAYEYLEHRFDLKTRSLGAFLFLVQRGLAAGITIYAPSLILSVALGWDVHATVLIIGSLVVAYTAWGGSRAVGHTHVLQMAIIWGGMFTAAALLLRQLPPDLSVGDVLGVAGRLGKLKAVNFKFDLHERYNLWSGLIGGFFLAFSYFGTDQSQAARYLSGQSVKQSRLGLLVNGIVKVPMQLGILFLGVLVFMTYLFVTPPLFFNTVATGQMHRGPYSAAYHALEQEHEAASEVQRSHVRGLISARRSGDLARVDLEASALQHSQEDLKSVRARAVALIQRQDPHAQANDTNYIFLNFILKFMPAGVVGLFLAAVFAASMSASSSELTALSSTFMVDIYKRLLRPGPETGSDLGISRFATLGWGLFAIGFAEYANHLGTLIEAVNILGSLFYGTILGIFLVAFYLKWVGGTAVFISALLAEAAVLACFKFSHISFLWYNVIGCLLVMGLAMLFQPFTKRAVPAVITS